MKYHKYLIGAVSVKYSNINKRNLFEKLVCIKKTITNKNFETFAFRSNKLGFSGGLLKKKDTTTLILMETYERVNTEKDRIHFNKKLIHMYVTL